MKVFKRSCAALAAGAMVALLSVSVGTPAEASQTPVDARGNTVLKFNAQALKPMMTGACGPFFAVASTGGGELLVTQGTKFQITLPITGVVVNPDNDDAIKIAHAASGFEISNSCFDLRLTNFYIENFGTAQQTTVYDVTARALENGVPTGRTATFQVDLTNANITTTAHGATKVRAADLLLDTDGADQFNNLATGTPVGPYSPGQQVGKARTTVRLLY